MWPILLVRDKQCCRGKGWNGVLNCLLLRGGVGVGWPLPQSLESCTHALCGHTSLTCFHLLCSCCSLGTSTLNILCFSRRFSPEVLGLCASTAFVWMVIEVLALLLGLYLATVQSDLGTFDLLAYCGYKYVGYVSIRTLQLAPQTYSMRLWVMPHSSWAHFRLQG